MFTRFFEPLDQGRETGLQLQTSEAAAHNKPSCFQKLAWARFQHLPLGSEGACLTTKRIRPPHLPDRYKAAPASHLPWEPGAASDADLSSLQRLTHRGSHGVGIDAKWTNLPAGLEDLRAWLKVDSGLGQGWFEVMKPA